MFYKQFIYDDKIFLGKYLPSNSSPVPSEICRYLVPTAISTEKTPKGLLMLVKANFMAYRDTVFDWLESIHLSFPQLEIYLHYSNKTQAQEGEFFTNGPTEFQGTEQSLTTLSHNIKEHQWYDLKQEDLISKLEQGFYISKQQN
jgi:hypothetical protein